jgi:LysM repeat protein
MNNPSPLVPQGSLQEQKNQGRARVKIAVFVVLAIHGLGLLALLMQGCQQKETPPEVPPVDTNAIPAMDMTNLPPVDTNYVPPVATNTAVEPVTQLPQVTPGTPTAGATTYAVARGDTLGGIAKKFNVSLKALSEANPTVQATKLQIGQKLQIPASNAPAGTVAPTAIEGAAQTTTYTVKSGDTLTKIATHFGVPLKALRAANNLKTDSIKVGQKLKIPVRSSAPAPAPAPAPSVPEAAPVATPVPTTTPSQ